MINTLPEQSGSGDSGNCSSVSMPEPSEIVFLIGLDLKDEKNFPRHPSETAGSRSFCFEKSLKEMKSLAEAAGMTVSATFTQSLPKANTGYYIGSGKIEEIRAAAEMLSPSRILIDSQLTPMQLRNLTEAFDLPVTDRTALILEIFSGRARTHEANLQVEYAKLQYMLPRLAGLHKELGRQGGTSGAMSNKGLGEKKIELDRRHIEHKMAEVRRQLEDVSRERATQRNARMRSGLSRVSLAGYTNAGKSTIMNGLLSLFGDAADRQVLEKDMLFATLDTTVRRIEPGKDRSPFLLSDTVGFIDNLPTTLIKAFRSTLEEAKYADLLLIVSDLSDPDYKENLSVTVSTLSEIGAGDIPRLYVFNKADRAPEEIGSNISSLLISDEDARITISAKNPKDIERLADAICSCLNREKKETKLLIPYSNGSIISVLKASSDLTILDYTAQGTVISAWLSEADRTKYRSFLLPEA